MGPRERIRNFCIIAHIDHGKSTLADRLLEKVGIVNQRDFHDQMLDSMDIEQERGITIKSQAVCLPYRCPRTGELYQLNLVDTPGHVDFSYEVSRAIASCEGALLLVDATQGVEAQTFSNMYLALEYNLQILPVVNKIDLPNANKSLVAHQIEHDLGVSIDPLYSISAKTGEGIAPLFEGIIKHIPSPQGERSVPLQAIIFDSHYDPYRGAVMHVRLFLGQIRAGETIKLFSNDKEYVVEEVGIFRLKMHKVDLLEAGEIGYFIAGIRSLSEIRIGDTVTLAHKPCSAPLQGYREVKPVVFSSVYPIDTTQYEELERALARLRLNDASFLYEKDSSPSLGSGFRCGFLGLLHLEVTQERLEREFSLGVVLTSPSVRYRIKDESGVVSFLDNPSAYPEGGGIESVEEPYIRATIITPREFLGGIMMLCTRKRGVQKAMTCLDEKRVEILYDMPFAETLFDFADKLKSVSRGYASFDYEIIDYRPTRLAKLTIMVNGEAVDALSQLVLLDQAHQRGKMICKKLQKEIPRQQFKIPIQAATGGTIVARETISPFRKNVTGKCYGGDITRKRKLLEKQKKGKKRMKMVGNVALPQSAFLSVLKQDEGG